MVGWNHFIAHPPNTKTFPQGLFCFAVLEARVGAEQHSLHIT